MILDREALGAMLLQAAKLLEENIQERVPQWGEDSIKDFLDSLGMAVMEVKGGSAGPLYGTMIGGLGVNLDDDAGQVDEAGLKAMFAGCLSEMEDITTAKVGDKTMMDALIPAVQAAQQTQEDCKAILESAAQAAQEGAKASEQFVSKFGRARSYKEQTIGTPDAGAVSTALFFRGLAQGI